MESHQETEATADTSFLTLSGNRTGSGTEVKKKRQKHSLYISVRFLRLTLRPREITLEKENMLLSDDITPTTLDILRAFYC